MKSLLLSISIVIFSMTSFASGAGTGGGGSKPGQSFQADSPRDLSDFLADKTLDLKEFGLNPNVSEIVYKISEQEGVVSFSYGQSNGDEWNIKKFKALESKIKENPALEKALLESVQFKEWIKINTK